VSAARRGDAASRTSVKVTIVGDEYTLRSDAPEAHTRAVADHVDRVIRK
jgi:cell division protein ZapA (FtsZ GTPase activity inhibitor)